MKIVNTTPFVLFPLLGEVTPPARCCTIVLKATFKLAQDKSWQPAKKQREPQPDTPFMDDIGRSLAWASDLVAFKPNVDVLIQGAFHQPGGEPAPEGRGGFKIGPIEKELVFRGPRFLVLNGNGQWSISPAQPMAQVPLRWEYSFGGLSDPRNPLGRGIEPSPDEKGPEHIPLPQIEYSDDGFRKPGDRPRAANFAPVPPRFAERRSKQGTRDQRWANFCAPLPPKDYDPSIHNAAPGDQQARGYPRGDESMLLRNLHPRFPEWSTRLPGLRARAGILRMLPGGKGPDDVRAEEVRMRLDTIVVLPEDDELVLLWRGVVPLHGRKDKEILLLRAETEQVADEPAAFELFAARMWETYRKTLPPEKKPPQAPDISGEMGEMRRLLAKVDLPPALRDAVENEANPKTVFDALEKHLSETVAALQKKYPMP
jgi:hypothetical protein